LKHQIFTKYLRENFNGEIKIEPSREVIQGFSYYTTPKTSFPMDEDAYNRHIQRFPNAILKFTGTLF